MFPSPSANSYYYQHRYDQMPCRSLPYQDRAAVIIETRDMPVLPWTINNIIYFTQWPVIVYHSQLNTAYLEHVHLKKKIEISPDFSVDNYNELLVSTDFWQSLPPYVLIFQTDSFMLRSGIDSYTKYDYIGAPWTKKNIKSFSIPRNIGNGGFSLRRRDKMMQIIEACPYKKGLAEDVYFAHGFDTVGGKLPSIRIKKGFSVEQIYFNKPLGVHAPWLAFDDKKLGRLFELPAVS